MTLFTIMIANYYDSRYLTDFLDIDHGKKFLSSRLAYHSNSVAGFQLTRLLSSGGVCPICPDPGPISSGNKAGSS